MVGWSYLRSSPSFRANMGYQQQRALDLVTFYRSAILDLLDEEFGETTRWDFVRKRILHLLGDRGLFGQMTAILSSSSTHNELEYVERRKT